MVHCLKMLIWSPADGQKPTRNKPSQKTLRQGLWVELLRSVFCGVRPRALFQDSLFCASFAKEWENAICTEIRSRLVTVHLPGDVFLQLSRVWGIELHFEGKHPTSTWKQCHDWVAKNAYKTIRLHQNKNIFSRLLKNDYITKYN